MDFDKIKLSYSDFKSYISGKDISKIYVQDGTKYHLYAYCECCSIYTYVYEDTDITDFENNYKDDFNTKGACEIIPRTKKNEHTMIPFGMRKAKFSADKFCRTITLTNKDTENDTFDYASNSPFDPVVDGEIVQEIKTGEITYTYRALITDVDTVNKKITLSSDQHDNIVISTSAETTLLSNPAVNVINSID